MSLNPGDSRRRGRSRSPGRQDNDRDRSRHRGSEDVLRDRNRVVVDRAPSPPSSRYNDRDRYDEYEEETTVQTSKGGRERDDVRYTSSRRYRDESPERPAYAIPGQYKDVEVEKDLKIRYGDRREKDHYEERKYSLKEDYESTSPGSEGFAKSSSHRYEYDDPHPKDSWRFNDDREEKDWKSSFNISAGFSHGRSDSPSRDYHRTGSPPFRRSSPPYHRESPSRQVSLSRRETPSSRDDSLPRRHGSPPRRRETPSSREDSPLRRGVSPRRQESPSSRETSPPRRRELDSVKSRQDSPRRESPPSRSDSPPRRRELESVKFRQDSPRRESPPPRSESPPHVPSYAEPKKWEYAVPEDKVKYTRKESYTSRSANSSSSQTKVVTVEPGQRRTGSDSLAPRMGSLTVSPAHTTSASLATAPGSPLLEAYHGTYQSISPMPSPLMITAGLHGSNADIPDLEPLSPVTSRRRHARFHDPGADAASLARALSGSKSPDIDPLIEILPALTHDQVMDLRVEYKKIVKTGSEKKGVNIAKHIKLRLKDEDGPILKACYAIALGQWESEAYWANFWYHGEKSRRELLIESLMGRTNAEIRAIKDGFSDKKYSDSLVKCMKMELKEDKFKKAVLLVLGEERMEERSGYSLDRKQVEDDVRELRKAVKAEKGGETTMINIIVLRSDSHIREILRVYEASFHANFAREMLKKSGNLVGELLAHILNGVINRPVRDALLINHALSLTKSDHLRTELLISRLVRYHWDRPHMEAVKREYRKRYGKELQQAVHEGTKGVWGHICEELCVKRTPDDVKRVERVERIEANFKLG